MALALAAAAALAIALARALSDPTAGILPNVVLALAAVLAIASAFFAAAAVVTASVERESPSNLGPRSARFAPALFGAASAVPLVGQVLQPPYWAGQAAARGGQGLAVSALVLLAGYLCFHLRASLVRGRWWLTLGVVAVEGLSVAALWRPPSGPALVLLAVVLSLAATRTATLAGVAPGTLGARAPLGELAALAALAQPILWDGAIPLAGATIWLLLALILDLAVRRFPALRAPAAIATLVTVAALLFEVLSGGRPSTFWRLAEGLAIPLVCVGGCLLAGALESRRAAAG